MNSLKYIFNIGDVLKEYPLEIARKKQINGILERLNCEFDGKNLNRLGDIEFSQEEVKKISGSLTASKNPSVSASAATETEGSHSSKQIKYISFSEVSHLLSEFINILDNVKVLCLLDEWSELPINLQPYILGIA